MKHKRLSTIFMVLLLAVFSATVFAASHGYKKPKKVGILLVAFGSSKQSAYGRFLNAVR